MRADFLARVCPMMTGRDAVLLLLTSDKEITDNPNDISKSHGRTVEDIFRYNSKISHKTLYRLVDEGFIERVGFNYRLRMYPKVGHTA